MYYHCPACGLKFKYPLDMMADIGEDFGKCPECGSPGTYECDGPRKEDDNEYIEVE